MNDQDRSLGDWIDGELRGSELREFEKRLSQDPVLAEEAEIAGRVEASLKRTFAVGSGTPSGALRVAESLQHVAISEERTPVRAWTLGACVALAAACLVLFLVLPTNESGADAVRFVGADRIEPTSLERVAAVRHGGHARVRPDLEDIYCSAQEYAARRDPDCEVAVPPSMRVGELIADHGAALGLWPNAALDLEGPILSPEWPGSMIFAGGEPGEMSVLIAERDATHTCCLDVELPETSNLRLHSWRVGEVLWFEVSPFEQPRLLPRLLSELQ